MERSDSRALQAIVKELMPEEGPPRSIPCSQVLEWMRSDDLETAGAVYQLIMDDSHYTRITPPLTVQDYVAFLKTYYRRCVLEDPSGEWADGRYDAAWGIARWIVHLWHDASVPRSVLVELKEWLLSLYCEGNEDVRTSLVTGSLEHLFEDPELVTFFSNWGSDPSVQSAYEEALGYAETLRTRPTRNEETS